MSKDLKQQIFEKRQNEIIVSIISKIKNIKSINEFYKLLYYISFHRFETAKMSTPQDKELYEQFGRVRFNNASWGRNMTNDSYKYWDKEFMNEMYYPLFHKLKSKHEVLITPIFKKYEMYLDKLKNICNNSLIDTNFVKKNKYIGLTNFVVINILNKSEPGVHITYFDNKPFTLFYYENDDKLLNSVEKYGSKNFLSSNILLYKAIYHTSPEFHEFILNQCFQTFLDYFNGNMSLEKIGIVFWFLSQATLYDRGSASITEIICSSMLSILRKENIKICCKYKNIYLDIEAMSNTLNDFLQYWNSNIDKFVSIFIISNESSAIYNSILRHDIIINNEDILNDLQTEFKC
jgi:hypothetical protein